MAVVMEGVETEEQLALVTGHAGIGLVQGDLLGRPAPVADLRAWLAGERPREVA